MAPFNEILDKFQIITLSGKPIKGAEPNGNGATIVHSRDISLEQLLNCLKQLL